MKEIIIAVATIVATPVAVCILYGTAFIVVKSVSKIINVVKNAD